MNQLKIFLVLLLAALAPASFAASPVPAATASAATPVVADVPQLVPTDTESAVSTMVANLMTRYHYDAQPLDDQMSARIFDNYLDMLDSQRMLFTQADVARFEKAKTTLDDAIWGGELKLPFAMFNLYTERLAERTRFALGLLDEGFAFTTDETYQFDREDAPWASSKAGLDELWRKRVKNDWLRLKLAGKEESAIRETLGNRYSGYLERVRELEPEDVFQSFMNSYTQSIDPHTNYLGPRASENFDIAMKLSLEGIGAVLERRDDYTQVRSVVPGGPAGKSDKLHAGDRIVGVGQGREEPITDVIGWRLDDVVDLIRGPKGSVVRLEILPADSGPDAVHETFALVRDTVSIEEQAAKKSVIEISDGGVTRKIGVIELPTFYQDFQAHRLGDPNYRSATRDVRKLLGELKQQGVDGVIIDLRNNGGGSLSEATELTGLFIDQGPVVQVRDTRGRVTEERDTDSGLAWSGPLAVLVNRGSASASEIFAAAIQDYGRGLVIGSETFGKGTVQNLVSLDRVARKQEAELGDLKMTIAQFFRVDGGSTQLRGVTPDIVFPSSIDPTEFGESSYDAALPWSSIAPAAFESIADVDVLVPELRDKHAARIADNADWQLQVKELARLEKWRDRTTVSLNYETRKAERDQREAARKAALKQAHPEVEKAAGDNPQPASSASAPAPATSADPAAASSSAPATSGTVATKGDGSEPASAASKLILGRLPVDDGLQASERSLEEELEREEAIKNATDVQLQETAHILADAINMLRAKPELAAVALPQAAAVSATD